MGNRHTHTPRRWARDLFAAVVSGVVLASAQEVRPGADAGAAVEALRQAGANLAQQAAAVRALAAAGAAAEGALVALLGDEDAQVRANAAFALGRLRAAGAVDRLLGRLEAESDPGVRGAVIEALGRIGDARAAPVLIAHASREGTDEMDRRAAAVALGSLRAREGIPLLLRLLDSENWEERWRAAVALGQVGDVSVRPWVEARLRDADPVTAACAAWASETLGGVPGFSHLTQNLSSPDAGVVFGTAWALGVIGTPAAVEILRGTVAGGSPTAQAACTLVLAWLGSPPAETPAAPPSAVPAETGAVWPGEPLDLAGRWTDRYGGVEIEATRPVVFSHRGVAPALGAHARPALYALPNGDLLLAVEPEPGAGTGPRVARRSRDQGRTWQDEPTLVHRPNAVAVLRNRTVVVYDEYLFAREGGQAVCDVCVSRDGGRAFGPLLLAEFAVGADVSLRRASSDLAAAYAASSARWSDRGCGGLCGSVVETDAGDLVACSLARFSGDPSQRCLCYRSKDKGLTWTAGAALAEQDVSGAALAAGGEGRLAALLALGPEPVAHVTLSADGGAHWTAPRSLRVPAAGVALCTLDNGVLAACCGGPGVTLLFSLDGTGRVWTDRVVLADAGQNPVGRVGLAETGEGRLLVVYDRQEALPGAGPEPVPALFGSYVTVKRTTASQTPPGG